jgi:hypothetical protein
MRFHFQVRTQSHVMLTEAAEFSTTKQAREEASRRVGVLLFEHAGQLDEEWQMDVTDDTGLILFVISVTARKSPATTSYRVR